MLWLDSDYPIGTDPAKPDVSRGTCSTSSGKSADVEKNSPGSTVIFSNIKTGPIGSAFNSGDTGDGSSPNPGNPNTPKTTTTTAKPSTSTTTTKPTTTTAAGCGSACAAKHGQCGGQGWNGPTCCAAGSTCQANASTTRSACRSAGLK